MAKHVPHTHGLPSTSIKDGSHSASGQYTHPIDSHAHLVDGAIVADSQDSEGFLHFHSLADGDEWTSESLKSNSNMVSCDVLLHLDVLRKLAAPTDKAKENLKKMGLEIIPDKAKAKLERLGIDTEANNG
jgi:hypothetical protein